MKRVTAILSLVLVLALGGCAAMIDQGPTQEQLSNVDFGEMPKNYQESVKAYCSDFLKDPMSAIYEFPNRPVEGWAQELGKNGNTWQPGWLGVVLINAKNSFGAYTGKKAYKYLLMSDGTVIYLSQYLNTKNRFGS